VEIENWSSKDFVWRNFSSTNSSDIRHRRRQPNEFVEISSMTCIWWLSPSVRACAFSASYTVTSLLDGIAQSEASISQANHIFSPRQRAGLLGLKMYWVLHLLRYDEVFHSQQTSFQREPRIEGCFGVAEFTFSEIFCTTWRTRPLFCTCKQPGF